MENHLCLSLAPYTFDEVLFLHVKVHKYTLTNICVFYKITKKVAKRLRNYVIV